MLMRWISVEITEGSSPEVSETEVSETEVSETAGEVSVTPEKHVSDEAHTSADDATDDVDGLTRTMDEFGLDAAPASQEPTNEIAPLSSEDPNCLVVVESEEQFQDIRLSLGADGTADGGDPLVVAANWGTGAEVCTVIPDTNCLIDFESEEQFQDIRLSLGADGTADENAPAVSGENGGTSEYNCTAIPEQPITMSVGSSPVALANTGGADIVGGIMLGAVLLTLGARLLFKRRALSR